MDEWSTDPLTVVTMATVYLVVSIVEIADEFQIYFGLYVCMYVCMYMYV